MNRPGLLAHGTFSRCPIELDQTAIMLIKERLVRIPSAVVVVLVLLALIPGAMAQNPPAILPKVVQHAEPVYPPLARQARIGGEVLVKITTDGESVRDAEAQTGPGLLRKAAEDNVRTWKFAAHTPGTFQVIFRYKLLAGNADVEFLESPGIVKIETSLPEAIIDYSGIGLGTWKAELRSARGQSEQTFSLYYTGPEGEWLRGRALYPNGESEEIDFGYQKKDFLAFTIKLRLPKGQHLKTFLIGKKTGDKIVGVFIDDSGIRGEWTATRVADSPASP